MSRALPLLILASGLTLAGCEHAPSAPRVVGQLAWDRVELTAEAAEPILTLPVQEGQQVAAGALLAQLDDTRARARLAQAAAERGRAAAALAELRRGPRAEKIAAALATLEGAEATLAQAGRDLRRQRELARKKLVSPEAVDRATAAQERGQAARDAAAALLAELRHGATAEEQTQAEQTLARAVAAEQEAQVAVERLRVIAPRPGRVDALPFEVGERPALGAVVAVLLVGDAPYARVYVPEPLRAVVQPGAAAQVWVDGQVQPFPGRIRRVSSDPLFTPYFALTERDRHYLSYVAEVVLEGAKELPAGIPVEVALTLPGTPPR